MTRRLSWGLALLIACACPIQARADPPDCAVPDGLALGDIELPLARAAAASKTLGILVVGGAASAGNAAGGADYTYAARLQARLREQLPGIAITASTRAVPRRTATFTVRNIEADIADTHANLVIWGVGETEAGNGVDVDELADTVVSGIAKIHAAGADVILMDVQYAPSIVRVMNLAPYREVILRVGRDEGVAVLDRYELMRGWSDDGILDLDATSPKERVQVARRLFDCIAAALADGIAPALK